MFSFLIGLIFIFVVLTIVFFILGLTGVATILGFTIGILVKIFLAVAIILIIIWLVGKLFGLFM